MKKILLTGFGPFSDIAINPSEVLVDQLRNHRRSRDDIQTDVIILPVDYKKAGVIIESLDFSKYYFVFQFGVAAGRNRISLERVALNWIESSIPDNAGVHESPQKMDESAPEALFNSLPLSGICRDLNQKYNNSVEVSFTAGAYLCNYVYFKSLAKTNRCLFTHIPLKLKWNQDEFFSQDERYQDVVLKIGLDLIDSI